MKGAYIMKLPDFTKNSWLNELRKKIWADLNLLYRPENNPIWDLKVETLLKNWELNNLYLPEIKVNPQELLEYKQNKIILFRETQVERITEGSHQFHFYNCATVNKWREDKKYNWKYKISRNTFFKVNIESYWKNIQKYVSVDLKVCKNCLKESNYYNYESSDYNKKNNIYKNFSVIEYFEAVD